MDHDAKNSRTDVAESDEFLSLKAEWEHLDSEDRRARFFHLPRLEAEEIFLHISSKDQHDLIEPLSGVERRSWIRLLAPHDTADLVQTFADDERDQVLALLDEASIGEVTALMAYAEDAAGGLMNPRFIRLRADATVDVAIRYLRAQAKTPVESLHYGYVLGADQKLVGVVSFRELLLAAPGFEIAKLMKTQIQSLPEHLDQEEISRRFSQTGLSALPVVDAEGRMKGIVTVHDAADVAEEEATEDIQKLGGQEALDYPYIKTDFFEMIRKRAGWLTVLFIGEMFTATAMGFFANEIERAVVLALFIPLIISSGGNSGSQAASLIIRAIALHEIRLRDWWRVLFREMASGFTLGLILGVIGMLRVLLWPARLTMYGEHYALVAVVVGVSLIGVVLWGAVAGAMLPFILRAVGFDPASASAPFVATLVDVTGLVIYFSVASLVLGGTLL